MVFDATLAKIFTGVSLQMAVKLATAILMAPNTLPVIQQLEIASVRRITKDERVIVVSLVIGKH